MVMMSSVVMFYLKVSWSVYQGMQSYLEVSHYNLDVPNLFYNYLNQNVDDRFCYWDAHSLLGPGDSKGDLLLSFQRCPGYQPWLLVVHFQL